MTPQTNNNTGPATAINAAEPFTMSITAMANIVLRKVALVAIVGVVSVLLAISSTADILSATLGLSPVTIGMVFTMIYLLFRNHKNKNDDTTTEEEKDTAKQNTPTDIDLTSTSKSNNNKPSEIIDLTNVPDSEEEEEEEDCVGCPDCLSQAHKKKKKTKKRVPIVKEQDDNLTTVEPDEGEDCAGCEDCQASLYYCADASKFTGMSQKDGTCRRSLLHTRRSS